MGKNKKKSKSTSTPTKNGATTANNQSLRPRTNHNTAASWSSSEECAYYARLGCHIAAIAKANDATCSRQRRPPPRHDDRNGNSLRRSNGRGKKHKQTSKRRTGTSDYENENCQNPTSLQKVLEEYPWILGMERFDPEDYHPEDIDCIPDIALNGGCDHVSGEAGEDEMVNIGQGEDEDESEVGDDGWQDCDEEELGISGEENDPMTLTLTNVTDTTKICFVTVYDVDLCGRDGSILQSGWTYVTTSFDGGSAGASDGGKEDAANKNNFAARIRDDESDRKEENSSSPVTTKATTTTIRRKCTTFIVLCPPQTFIHLCSLAPKQFQTNATTTTAAFASIKTERNLKNPITKWSQIEIESDIQPWSNHQNIDDEHPHLLHFPFHPIPKTAQQTDDINESNHDIATTNDNANDLFANAKQTMKNKTNENTTTLKAYLCTQSENGHLTHFFHGNYHAIDFACPIGTPLYSAVDGVVVAVKDDAVGGGGADSGDDEMDSIKNIASDGEKSNRILEVSGIATKNLFYWNSIMIGANINNSDQEEDDPLYIEYVHIQTNSSKVKVGDTVRKGQWICNSGSVGFSPEPHLHLAAYRRCGDKEPTVRVRFACHSDDADDVAEVKGKGEAFLPRAGGWYTEQGLVELS